MYVFYLLVVALLIFQVDCDDSCSTRDKCMPTGGSSMTCHNLIPTSLPNGTTRVTLECFEGMYRKIDINATTFSGEGWNTVQMLEIKDPVGRLTHRNIKLYSDAFAPLTQLIELGVHMTSAHFYPGVFNGLDKLETLDLSNCTVISETALHDMLSETVLKNLTTLKLSRVGIRSSGITIDNHLNAFFGARPIKFLDISYLHLTLLNFTGFSFSCDKMETITAKGLISTGLYQKYSQDNVCRNLKMVDISELRTSHSYICAGPDFSVEDNVNFRIDLKGLKPFSKAEEFVANNFCLSPITLKNVTKFRFDTTVPWYIRRLNFDHNFLEYADIEILCDNSTIEHLSLRFNNMRYISPKFFTCMDTLKTLDLGNNKLYVMQDTDDRTFEELLKFLPRLEQVSLRSNSLTSIPQNMFTRNINLTILDLSGNDIQEFHANVTTLKEIKLLNISNNKIVALDSKLLDALSAISTKKSNVVKAERKPWLDLSGNPFSCLICDDYLYLTWILSNRDVIYFPEKLRCNNYNGESVVIAQETTDNIKTICEQSAHVKNIAITTTVSLIITCLFAGSIYAGRTLYVALNKKRREEIILRKIREGQDEYEFVVFLAYSNADEDFVKHHVLKELQDALETLTETIRCLICTGDDKFRPGHSIPKEVDHCFNRCSAVMFILTNSSLASGYCKTEFDTAVMRSKPIIFMFKEVIDEELLSPQMKVVFHKQARILWKQDGDDYVLATSWENVSKAILNMLVES